MLCITSLRYINEKGRNGKWNYHTPQWWIKLNEVIKGMSWIFDVICSCNRMRVRSVWEFLLYTWYTGWICVFLSMMGSIRSRAECEHQMVLIILGYVRALRIWYDEMLLPCYWNGKKDDEGTWNGECVWHHHREVAEKNKYGGYMMEAKNNTYWTKENSIKINELPAKYSCLRHELGLSPPMAKLTLGLPHIMNHISI